MTMRRIAALSLLVLGLAGCASKAPTVVTSGGGAPGSAAVSPAAVALDEHANRTTVKAVVGATVEVDLHSTYWSAVTSSAPQDLQSTGSPSASPGPSCHPGGGCGTVTSTFKALAPGTVQLTASRSSCGEAKPCAPDEQTYTVTVEVSAS